MITELNRNKSGKFDPWLCSKVGEYDIYELFRLKFVMPKMNVTTGRYKLIEKIFAENGGKRNRREFVVPYNNTRAFSSCFTFLCSYLMISIIVSRLGTSLSKTIGALTVDFHLVISIILLDSTSSILTRDNSNLIALRSPI